MPAPQQTIPPTAAAHLERRQLLGAATRSAGSLFSPAALPPQAAGATPSLGADPFTLGAASGDPEPHGVVLWTRLAPDPLRGGGMPRERVRVDWMVAEDEGRHRGARRGTAPVSPIPEAAPAPMRGAGRTRRASRGTSCEPAMNTTIAGSVTSPARSGERARGRARAAGTAGWRGSTRARRRCPPGGRARPARHAPVRVRHSPRRGRRRECDQGRNSNSIWPTTSTWTTRKRLSASVSSEGRP
jgi:PhoD-like phosphatase, N-terminal domain